MPPLQKIPLFPERLVLENVPQVNFFNGGRRCPEDICLPSVLRAITEYLDDQDYGCKKCQSRKFNCPISCSYAFFVGVTGAAFFLSWKDGWQGDNVAAFYLDTDAASMEKHAIKAIGYDFEWLMPGDHEQFLLMWELWDKAGGIGNPEAWIKFTDPAVRHKMIPIIHQARGKDAQAANHLEQVLVHWH